MLNSLVRIEHLSLDTQQGWQVLGFKVCHFVKQILKCSGLGGFCCGLGFFFFFNKTLTAFTSK